MWARIKAGLALAFVLTLGGSGPLAAAPPEPKGDQQFWDDYWQGVMALRQAHWTEALESLGRAAKRDPSSGRTWLARGVAQTILGDSAGARADLERVRSMPGREAKLWEAAADMMSEKPGATFYGVPGHMVQGGDDYPTAYASAVIYEFAAPVRAAREARKPIDAPELAAAGRKAGKWFANRTLATPELISRNFREARRLMEQDKVLEARELIDLARTVYPFDPDMAALSGDIWRKAGRPATARADYTIAATMKTDLAAAYAGRAEAAATLGDARTARADLANAARYDGLPAGLKERVETTIARTHVDADPAALLAELDAAATAGADADKLQAVAGRLQRAAAERRVRYDEVYQENIRRLEDAARANPAALAPRVELAQYLYDEVDSRGEQVEPRRGVHPFRWQYTQALELGRAVHAADDALRIDPQHVPALVAKAYAVTALGRGADAERLIDQALQLAGTGNADAIRLLAVYRQRQIGRMRGEAARLRTPTYTSSSTTQQRSDGVYRVTTTVRHDPSPADLARADDLDREARGRIQQTKRLMESAIEVTRDSLDGLLLQASYEDWFGTRDRALQILEQAVKAYPKSVKAHDARIDYLYLVGRPEAAIRQEAESWQLFQTTCAPLLRLTWNNLRQQGWAAMTKDLEQARRLDPTDARATTYLAIALNDLGEPKRVVALLQVALALEQSRIDLDDQGLARRWPRPAADLADLIQLHLDLGTVLKVNGQAGQALANFLTASELASRYPVDGAGTVMFGAMRPDARAPELPVPAPINGATLAARANLGTALELRAAGRPADARKYLEAAVRDVRRHDSKVPNVGNARGDTNFAGFSEGAAATALLELAKDDIAKKRYGSAFRYLQDAGEAKPNAEERRQMNDLMLKIRPNLNGKGQ